MNTCGDALTTYKMDISSGTSGTTSDTVKPTVLTESPTSLPKQMDTVSVTSISSNSSSVTMRYIAIIVGTVLVIIIVTLILLNLHPNGKTSVNVQPEPKIQVPDPKENTTKTTGQSFTKPLEKVKNKRSQS